MCSLWGSVSKGIAVITQILQKTAVQAQRAKQQDNLVSYNPGKESQNYQFGGFHAENALIFSGQLTRKVTKLVIYLNVIQNVWNQEKQKCEMQKQT